MSHVKDRRRYSSLTAFSTPYVAGLDNLDDHTFESSMINMMRHRKVEPQISPVCAGEVQNGHFVQSPISQNVSPCTGNLC